MNETAADASLGDTAPLADRVAQKDRLLQAAFLHAAFDGWSRRTLLQAAADSGIDSRTATRLFPQAGDSLVLWIDDWADRQMLHRAGAELERMGVRARVSALVRARLDALAPHKEAVRRAMLTRSLPQNGWATIKSLWQTVDRIWTAAGFPLDRDTGMARYTRRLSLAGVLTATALYWLEDRSDGHAETWAFLERRIDDVMRLGRATSGLRRFTDRFRRPGAQPT